MIKNTWRNFLARIYLSINFVSYLVFAFILLLVLPTDNSLAKKPQKTEIINLIERLNTDNKLERKKVVKTLKATGQDAVPLLVEAVLKEDNSQTRLNIKNIIHTISDRVVDTLIQALKNPNLEVRRRAIILLRDKNWRLKSKSSDIVPTFVNLLKDKDVKVRSAAAEILGRMGEQAAQSVPELIKLLKDWDVMVRYSAASTLGRIGEKAAPSVPQLITLLKDEDVIVRYGSAIALGKIGEKATPAVSQLIELLQDSDGDVRSGAADTLGEFREKARKAVPPLVKLLQDSDPYVRANAADTLGEIGKDATPAVSPLIKLLQDKDPKVRSSAASALGKFAQKAGEQAGEPAVQSIPQLIKLLKDKDVSVRGTAASTLGKFGKQAEEKAPQSVPGLIQLLKDKNSYVRSSAAIGLGGIGEPAAQSVPGLIQLLKDKDLIVRYSAINGLRGMGKLAAPALSSLTPMLQDRDAIIRSSTADVIGKIGETAIPLLPQLIQRLEDENLVVRSNSALAVQNIASTLKDKALENHLSLSQLNQIVPHLNSAAKIIENPSNNFSNHSIYGLQKPLLLLQEKRNDLFWKWLLSHPFILSSSSYFFFLLSVWLFLYWLRPLSFLKINKFLKRYEFQLPKQLGGAYVRSRDLLLFSLFKSRRRIISAWVKKNIATSQKQLKQVQQPEQTKLELGVNQPEVNKLEVNKLEVNKPKLSKPEENKNIHIFALKIPRIANFNKQDPIDFESMLSYLDEFNENVVENQLDNHNIHQDAKTIAWECFKQSSKPEPIKRETALNALGGDDAESRLNYLEHHLRLIRSTGKEKDRISFVINPLAEYLAGLHQLEVSSDRSGEYVSDR